jgi:hypothetical protein
MATASYKSTLSVGGTVIKDTTSIDFPLKMNTDDTTSFSATTPGAETSIPTTYGSQIKLSGNRNSTDTAQNALRTAWINRTTVTVVYDILGDTTETYTATCWVTDWDVKADPKKAAKFDATLVATGAITIV